MGVSRVKRLQQARVTRVLLWQIMFETFNVKGLYIAVQVTSPPGRTHETSIKLEPALVPR